mgnify:FL=1
MTFDGEELNTKYLLFYAFKLINIQLIKKINKFIYLCKVIVVNNKM